MYAQFLPAALLWCLTVTAVMAGDVVIRPGQHFLLLATKRTSTMQQELEQATLQGFRVVRGAPVRSDQIGFFLERARRPVAADHYVLLATSRVGTMEREMNELARAGYRLHPESLMWVDCEIVLLMERAATEDGDFDYELLATKRTSTLEAEVEAARSRGFELADMILTDENLVVMERVK